jgi:hypothetical protein
MSLLQGSAEIERNIRLAECRPQYIAPQEALETVQGTRHLGIVVGRAQGVEALQIGSKDAPDAIPLGQAC